MTREILFDTPSAFFAYDSRDFLYAKSMGYLSPEKWSEDKKEFTKILLNKKTSRVIADYSEFNGTWFPVMKWLHNALKDIVSEIGSIKLAFIYSRNEVSTYSINRFLEQLGESSDNINFQVFTREPEAIQWLINESEHISNTNDFDLLSLKCDGEYRIIDVNDIYYVYCQNKTIHLVLREKTYETGGTIHDFHLTLPDFFVQIHRAYIVNLKKIETLSYYSGGSYITYLKDFPDERLTIGKKYAPLVKKMLGIQKNW